MNYVIVLGNYAVMLGNQAFWCSEFTWNLTTSTFGNFPFGSFVLLAKRSRKLANAESRFLDHRTNSSALNPNIWLTHTNENDVAVASQRPPFGVKCHNCISRYPTFWSCAVSKVITLPSRISVWAQFLLTLHLKARSRMKHLKSKTWEFWSGYGDAQHGQRAETSPPLPGTPRKPHSMEKKKLS